MFSRRTAPFLLALLILVLPFLTSPGGFHSAQTQSVQPPPTTATDPPGTIDGAKNPELIPDEAAYQAVFLAFAEHENATEAEKVRFHAKIAAARLSNDDEQALFAILAAFRKQMEAVRAQVSAIMARNPIPHPNSVNYQELMDLTKQYKAVFAEAMSAVPARLSAEGVAKLDAHVKHEKRGMKYVPDMQAPN